MSEQLEQPATRMRDLTVPANWDDQYEETEGDVIQSTKKSG